MASARRRCSPGAHTTPAVELARTAVELAAGTDALLDHADARRTYAVVLRAAGRRAAADVEYRHALALRDAKGATLLAERARGSLSGAVARDADTASPAAIFRNAAARAARDLPGATLVATRGDRLALLRVGAALPTVACPASKLDDGGNPLAPRRFALEALAAAHAALTTAWRYAATEAAPYPQTPVYRAFGRAFATRDWRAMLELLAPEIVVHDHRVLGWEPLRGPAAYVEAIRSLVDLAPDTALRIDHVRMTPHAALGVTTWTGTRDGGPFETPSITVFQLDPRGRPRRFDQYDLHDADEAVRQLDSITPRGLGDATDVRSRPETTSGGARFCLRGFPLPILRRGAGLEAVQQVVGYVRDRSTAAWNAAAFPCDGV